MPQDQYQGVTLCMVPCSQLWRHGWPDGQLTVPGGPNQALTLRTSPSPRAQYWGSWMSPASAGICSNSGCCAR